MAEANPSRGTLTLRRVGRHILIAVAVIVLPLLILWGGFALWYQIPGGPIVKAMTAARAATSAAFWKASRATSAEGVSPSIMSPSADSCGSTTVKE